MIRNETIEEFKKRGGKVTKLETVDSSNDYLFSATCSVGWSNAQKPRSVTTVSWSDLHAEEGDDKKATQYWKKLNKAMDKVIKKKGI